EGHDAAPHLPSPPSAKFPVRAEPRKGALSLEDIAMRGIWRKWLGLSVGVLLGPAQAAEPSGPADPSPPVIASSRSTPAVSLGRPRPVVAPSGGVRQASFREEAPDAGLAIARSAAVDHQPMPNGPGSTPAPAIVTLPPPTPVSPPS